MDVNAVIAIGAILLTFMGGWIGNILTVYALRFKENRAENVNILQKIAIVIYIAIIVLIIGAFFGSVEFLGNRSGYRS